MSRHGGHTETRRKRALSRLHKLRGCLGGKPSALEFLLQERRKERGGLKRIPKGAPKAGAEW